MPITVKHGKDLEGLAALVALMAGAGQQQQAPQVPAMSNLIGYAPSGGGGGGGGGRVGGGGGSRGGQVAPPGEPTLEEELRIRMQMKLKEEQFGIPIEEERMRMEQQMQAEGWKLEYSSKARAEWAKGNESLRRINEGERSGWISPEEGEAMRQAVMQKMHGADKTWTPPDPNVPQFAPGEEPGVLRVHEGTGAIVQTKMGANGQPETSLVLRPDQTFEYLEKKSRAEQEKATLDLQAKQDEKEEASREKYDLARNAYKAKAFDKYSEIEDDPNVALRNAEVAAERLYPQLGPSRRDVRQKGEFSKELEGELEVRIQRRQLGAAKKYGVTFTEEESRAPANVREAILFTRAAAKQYRNRRAPPDVQAELTKAAAVMRRYDEEQKEQARMMQEAAQEAGPNPGWSGYGIGTDLE